MTQHIVLPALGESVSEGTVTRWLKRVGDSIEVGEPLVEVSTDKVDTEVVSTAAGIVEAILIAENETIDVGTTIATVSGESGVSDATPESPPTIRPAVAVPPTVAVEPVVVEPTPAVVRRQQDFRSPLVRTLLTRNALEGATIAGTGRGGRVRRDDVLAALGQRGAAAEIGSVRGTTVAMSRLRKVLASRALESLAATAQLTTVVEVDVTEVARLRLASKDDFRARTGLALTFLPFFAVAATAALREFPVINARIENDSIVYPATEDVNFAVDTDRGLLSPVLRNAGELDVEGIAIAVADLASRTRNNALRPDELSGGTFTITNTGSRGALFDTPIVFLPQVAILGTGAVTRRPVVITHDGEDRIAIRSMVYLALSYDHRAVDGADAARYLQAVKHILERGDFPMGASNQAT